MKTPLAVLIAEDDKAALESWERDISEFNRATDQTIRFDAYFAQNKQTALAILDRIRISCAVVDLRLPIDETSTGETTAMTGNDVLEQVLVANGIPAVVYSGHTQEASELVTKSLIKVLDKQKGGAMQALRWLAGHNTLMLAMEGTRVKLARESSRLFNSAIWPRWERVWKTEPNSEMMSDVITRQMATHIAERLGLPAVNYHPDEFYHIPISAAERLSTGDLTVVGGSVYVVVTPRCNMAHDPYPDHLLLALCKPMDGIWTGIKAKIAAGKAESATRELRAYATQGHHFASHFLPPCGDKGPWLVDFKEVMSIRSDQAPALQAARIASIATSFVPNLVQRYAAYLGRIGQPDLDCEVLRSQMAPAAAAAAAPAAGAK